MLQLRENLCVFEASSTPCVHNSDMKAFWDEMETIKLEDEMMDHLKSLTIMYDSFRDILSVKGDGISALN